MTWSVLPHRFGFHQPPFNSVDHLHLHCFALPFMPRYTNILHILLSHRLKLQKYDFLFLSHIVTKQMESRQVHVFGTFRWFYWSTETSGEDKASFFKSLTKTNLFNFIAVLKLAPKLFFFCWHVCYKMPHIIVGFVCKKDVLCYLM